MLIHVLQTQGSGCITAFMQVDNLPEIEGIMTLLPQAIMFGLNPRVGIPATITIGAWPK